MSRRFIVIRMRSRSSLFVLYPVPSSNSMELRVSGLKREYSSSAGNLRERICANIVSAFERFHLDIDLLPKDVYQIGFELDDQFIASVSTPLPRGWDSAPPYSLNVQTIGDRRISDGSSLGLRVPASVLPGRSNVLLNPSHPDMRRLREVERGPLPWPSRVVEFLQAIKKPGSGSNEPRRKK